MTGEAAARAARQRHLETKSESRFKKRDPIQSPEIKG
jgi:hypothetical protein